MPSPPSPPETSPGARPPQESRKTRRRFPKVVAPGPRQPGPLVSVGAIVEAHAANSEFSYILAQCPSNEGEGR
jgi:hypothetical protein